jgi:hypothetical protein
MAGRVVGSAVLPAPPHHSCPGAGEDSHGVGVVAAAGDGLAVDLGRPRRGASGVVGEEGHGLSQPLVAGPPEADVAVGAGVVGDWAQAQASPPSRPEGRLGGSRPSRRDGESGGSTIELGGPNGQKALQRLQNVVRRVADQWRPASSQESFEIVRRRLFEEPSAAALADIAAVARQFTQFYARHPGEFPREVIDPAYEQRIKAAYPLHPELFDRLYEDWSTLERFQRTRACCGWCPRWSTRCGWRRTPPR